MLALGRQRVGRRGGQLEKEHRAAPFVGAIPDGPAVGIDDAVAHRQSEAGALAHRLRDEERLEQLRFILRADPRSIVEHFETDSPAHVVHPDHDAPFAALRRLERLLRVDHEVENDLLDLGEIRVDAPRGRRLDVERDRRAVQIAAAELDDFRDDIAQIDERRRPGLLAAETRQVPDDLTRAAALRLDEGDLIEHVRRQSGMALEQLQRAKDRLQWIVELVRDARHQQPDGREALLANDLALERLQRLAHLALLSNLTIEGVARIAKIVGSREERILKLRQLQVRHARARGWTEIAFGDPPDRRPETVELPGELMREPEHQAEDPEDANAQNHQVAPPQRRHLGRDDFS